MKSSVVKSHTLIYDNQQLHNFITLLCNDGMMNDEDMLKRYEFFHPGYCISSQTSSPKYTVNVLTFLLRRFCSTSTLPPGPASKVI